MEETSKEIESLKNLIQKVREKQTLLPLQQEGDSTFIQVVKERKKEQLNKWFALLDRIERELDLQYRLRGASFSDLIQAFRVVTENINKNIDFLLGRPAETPQTYIDGRTISMQFNKEVTSGLSPQGREKIRRILSELLNGNDKQQ